MGISLDIFSLYQLRNPDAHCQHCLLLKVRQAEFRNADQGEYDFVAKVADAKRDALLQLYRTTILANECANHHEISLLGELQNAPIGDELYQEVGKFYVDLWLATTRFGHPWVVMGTAADEEEFWREVEQDEDLAYLEAIRPPRQKRAFFLTENDMQIDL
jgi:hypothetical protein